MIDIKKNDEVIETVNAILNNKGIAEIKNEVRRNGDDNIVVVEIKRQVRTRKPDGITRQTNNNNE